jgi:hypothetical protein
VMPAPVVTVPAISVPAITVPAQPAMQALPAAVTQNLPPFAVPSSIPVPGSSSLAAPPMVAPLQQPADRSVERYDRMPERSAMGTNGTPVAVPAANPLQTPRPEFASTANLLDRVDRALKNRYNN